jgi:iron complex outermembrane receptor protein
VPAAAVLAVWLAAPLAGQGAAVVYGVVSDSTGRPIANVRVEALEVGLAAVTESSGRYRLAGLPAGSVTLRATLIGFYPAQVNVRVAADDSVSALFRLRANPLTVNPVVVTAAKRSQLLDQAVTSVALVTEQQIARRAVNTIDEAVDRVPGVQMINGQVNVRGSSGFVLGLGSRVLLLIDGVPANQGDRGGINWDLVPVDRIERVEVVKGAGSALYGSAAFGGVVNLITRELPDGFHARLRATGGVFADPPHDAWRFRTSNGIEDGLDLAGSYGRGTVRGGLSVGARHSDGFVQQGKADHWQATGKGEWRPEPATHVSLSGALSSDQYQVPQPWCGRGSCDDQGLAVQPFKIDTANTGNRTRSDKGYVTALVSRTPSDQLSWLARASWLRTHFIDDFPNRQPPFSNADFAIANRYGAEGRLVSRPDPQRVVTVGVEVTMADVWSNIFSGNATGGTGRHTQGEYAAYAESEQVLGPARITIGARGDFLVVDGGAITAFVSPRAGAVWPTASGSWRASLGRAYRAPSQAERFVTTYALGFRVIPNPALRSEDGWSAEVGRTWTPLTWLRGDAAVFYTQARQLIEPVFNDSAVVIQFQNVQRARFLGLDLSITATPVPPHVTTTLAYQYLDARELATDTSPQRPLLFRPRHLLTLTADGAWRAFGVGADFRYSSRYERGDPLYPGDTRLAAKVLDLRASWGVGPLAVHLKVANALNYIYNLAPRTLEPVRTSTLTLTYTH